MTALNIAAGSGHKEIVAALLDGGADVNLEAKNGWTALLFALTEKRYFLLRPLLDAGADPNHKVEKGATALMMAAEIGHHFSVDTLLAAGAEVDLAHPSGATALYFAAQGGYSEILNTLIRAGASIDLEGPDGYTPLIIAAKNGHTDIVKTLLDTGADPHRRTRGGSTAFSLSETPGIKTMLQSASLPERPQPVQIAALLSNSSPKVTCEFQQRLTALGYNPGPADGLFGPKTQGALEKFILKTDESLEQMNVNVIGEPTLATYLYILRSVRISGSEIEFRPSLCPN